MGLFRDFITEAVRMNVTRKIRKNWNKNYKPGTFGIEIEFRVGSNEDEDDIDYDYAHEVFDRTVNKPPDIDDWLQDNPEPEKPDKKDYRWNPKDPLPNYWTLDMQQVAMGPPPPQFTGIKKYSGYDNYQDIAEMLDRFSSMWRGRGDPNNKAMFQTEENWERWKSGMRQLLYYLQPHVVDERRVNVYHKKPLSEEESAFLKQCFELLWDMLGQFVEFHEKRMKSLDEKDYRQRIIPIFRQDMEDWREKYREWEEERKEAEKAWKDWDEDAQFDRWLERHMDQFRMERDNRGNVGDEIEEVEEWFSSIGEPVSGSNAWEVFEDETGVVEIASPILTTAKLGVLKQLLEFLAITWFDEKLY